jgi:hypothetical protein
LFARFGVASPPVELVLASVVGCGPPIVTPICGRGSSFSPLSTPLSERSVARMSRLLSVSMSPGP